MPLPASVEALPAPTIESAPAAIELCSIPAFADALAAGDDAAAIAAAGGAEAFRTAVAEGTAPCVALDDPARVWVVLNKTRPYAPLDYRPAALVMPDGVRSIEGGSLRADAASALSAMAGASAAAGGGRDRAAERIPLVRDAADHVRESGRRPGRRGGRPRERAAGLQRAPVWTRGRRRRVRGRLRHSRRARRDGPGRMDRRALVGVRLDHPLRGRVYADHRATAPSRGTCATSAPSSPGRTTTAAGTRWRSSSGSRRHPTYLSRPGAGTVAAAVGGGIPQRRYPVPRIMGCDVTGVQHAHLCVP